MTLERSAGAPPAGAEQGGRASIPAEWDAAAIVTIAVDPVDERALRLEWIGDVARAWVGDRLVSDALWTGRPGASRPTFAATRPSCGSRSCPASRPHACASPAPRP